MISAQRHQSFGGAMIYILLAIGVLAVLTAIMSDGGGEQAQTQNESKLISEYESQINSITAAIQECVLSPNKEDSKLTSTHQRNPRYPLQSMSSYFSSSTPGPSSEETLVNIRCPNNPGGTDPNSQNHARIFTATSGRFFPPKPSVGDAWYYYSGNEGVGIFIGTSRRDAFIVNAMKKLDAKYSKCEADYLDATSGQVTVTSEGWGCSSGYHCFWYWIIRKPTALPACP